MEAEPVYFIDEVNENSVEKLMEAIKKSLGSNRGEVKVVFSTLGGRHNTALGFFGWLQRLPQKNRLIAIASGQLASAGLTMFLAFDRRSADPAAQIQFHRLSSFALREGVGEIMMEMIRSSERQLAELVVSRTKLTSEEAEKLLEDESWVAGDDLRRYGFINE